MPLSEDVRTIEDIRIEVDSFLAKEESKLAQAKKLDDEINVLRKRFPFFYIFLPSYHRKSREFSKVVRSFEISY